MIKEITVASEATYLADGGRLSGLKAINFIFGTNGSGKTTISRVIANVSAHPTCNVVWEGGQELECLVYNVDFVRRNFADQMPGIFTLGEEAGEAVEKINVARQRITDLGGAIRTIDATLTGEDGNGGKRGELSSLRARLEEQCWQLKLKYDADFAAVFEGLRGAKSRFCDKLLEEESTNEAELRPIEELKEKAATIFDKGVAKVEPVALPTFENLLLAETDPILTKKIIGKDDVDIAALIRRLEASDWVKEGLIYLKAARPFCPFCQQDAPADLERQLADYFDETFLQDIGAVERAKIQYETYGEAATQRLAEVARSGNRYLNVEALRAEIDRLSDRLEANKRILERKRKEPSTSVSLDPLKEVIDAIQSLILTANEKTEDHNRTVANLTNEKSVLSSQIWKYLVHDGAVVLGENQQQRVGVERAISALEEAKRAKASELQLVENELHELERKITSVEPTVSVINAILSSFGFTNFKLATAGEKGNLYEIVRPDGSNAATTLSEGERSFISFLYFYHLLRGSTTPSGTTNERVVVFDDPVSSLDSDVLFIVSSLIKRTLEEVCRENEKIKQVFVLTHNIYFHKEVTFDPKRGKGCRHHETFWIIRKLADRSEVVGYRYNPIKTSYELLWSEVRDPNRSKLSIQNTLRRILESYFKILGNIDKNNIIGKFQGKDQQICASLFAWVNAGSHSVHDDLYVSADDELIEHYLAVFREIFQKTENMGHYAMMIGDDLVGGPEKATETAA